ncbi:hypothetical protein AMTR_s00070p00139300 [Amborella trichopoda]|uniref:Uncharacterized protein n=1 Tax=Amborella trichopoda TaxID=13333 RepID=U5D4W2_AMBTC|nr:hypothetical protein AMTR_s00070p00139300 [Amborella trichopoda]
MEEDGGDGVSPIADIFEPPADARDPREDRHHPLKVSLSAAEAPHVGAGVEHVLDNLLAQGGLHAVEPRRHNLHGLEAEVFELAYCEGEEVVHLREEGLRVEMHHVDEGGAGETHCEVELAHRLHAGRLESYQRPDPDLADTPVSVVAATVEVSIVENPDGDDGAGVIHLPCVLLIPSRLKGVDNGSGAHPLRPVLGHAVGVGGLVPASVLHGHKTVRTDDADLENSDGRILCQKPVLCRPQVAAVVRRLVEDMVPALEAQPEVNPAREFHLLLLLRLGLSHRSRLLQAEPPRRSGDDINPARRARLSGDEQHIFLEGRVDRPPHRPRPLLLVPKLNPNCGLRHPPLLRRHQVLGLEDADSQVPELGCDINPRPGVHEPLVRCQDRRVRVPGVRKRLVRLGAHPNSQHNLTLSLPLPTLLLKLVPLWCHGAIRRHTRRHLPDLEQNPPHKIILHHILVLQHHLHHARLKPLLREGKNLVPHRVQILLEMLGLALVVPQLHLHIGVAAPAHVHGRKVSCFGDMNIEILHLLHQIVCARRLASFQQGLYLWGRLPHLKTWPPTTRHRQLHQFCLRQWCLRLLLLHWLEPEKPKPKSETRWVARRWFLKHPAPFLLFLALLFHRLLLHWHRAHGDFGIGRFLRREIKSVVDFEGDIATNVREQASLVEREAVEAGFALRDDRGSRYAHAAEEVVVVALGRGGLPVVVDGHVDGSVRQRVGVSDLEFEVLVP